MDRIQENSTCPKESSVSHGTTGYGLLHMCLNATVECWITTLSAFSRKANHYNTSFCIQRIDKPRCLTHPDKSNVTSKIYSWKWKNGLIKQVSSAMIVNNIPKSITYTSATDFDLHSQRKLERKLQAKSLLVNYTCCSFQRQNYFRLHVIASWGDFIYLHQWEREKKHFLH